LFVKRLLNLATGLGIGMTAKSIEGTLAPHIGKLQGGQVHAPTLGRNSTPILPRRSLVVSGHA
jgi:hypothetical protein